MDDFYNRVSELLNTKFQNVEPTTPPKTTQLPQKGQAEDDTRSHLKKLAVEISRIRNDFKEFQKTMESRQLSFEQKFYGQMDYLIKENKRGVNTQLSLDNKLRQLSSGIENNTAKINELRANFNNMKARMDNTQIAGGMHNWKPYQTEIKDLRKSPLRSASTNRASIPGQVSIDEFKDVSWKITPNKQSKWDQFTSSSSPPIRPVIKRDYTDDMTAEELNRQIKQLERELEQHKESSIIGYSVMNKQNAYVNQSFKRMTDLRKTPERSMYSTSGRRMSTPFKDWR